MSNNGVTDNKKPYCREVPDYAEHLIKTEKDSKAANLTIDERYKGVINTPDDRMVLGKAGAETVFPQEFTDLNPKDLLIVADLDDTLLQSNHELGEENRRAINEFIEMGGNFAVASGRIEESVRRLNIPTSVPSILYNGAALYDLNKEEFLWSLDMGGDPKGLAEAILAEFPEIGLEIFTKKGIHIVRQNAETDEHIDIVEGIKPQGYGFSLEEVGGEWMKIMLTWPGERLKEVMKWLNDLTKEGKIRYNYGPTYPILLEIISADADKGVALAKLSEILSIPLSHTIALGDNINDLSMLRTAGFSICPSNGVKKALDIADYVSVDNDSHVMRDVLNQLLKLWNK